MKYAPKKVFILENGKYKEITYSELQELEQSDKSYAEKFFLPLYGMLMEVTAETYKAYYKDKRNTWCGSLCGYKDECGSNGHKQNDCGGTKKSVSSAFARRTGTN